MKSISLITFLLISAATCGFATKPNVILIFTDDHGYSDLGCQGIQDDIKTPHLDSLAKGGHG